MLSSLFLCEVFLHVKVGVSFRRIFFMFSSGSFCEMHSSCYHQFYKQIFSCYHVIVGVSLRRALLTSSSVFSSFYRLRSYVMTFLHLIVGVSLRKDLFMLSSVFQ